MTEPLGGDLRLADRNHPAAVARLQARIAKARGLLEPIMSSPVAEPLRRPITLADQDQAVWLHYTGLLKADEQKRAAMPTPAEIDAERELVMKRIEAGEVDPDRSISGMFNAYTDYELKAGARGFDQNIRSRRLNAMRVAVDAGDTRLVDTVIQQYAAEQKVQVVSGSQEWRDLANKLIRAEIDALQQTLERDKGFFNDTPSDPSIKRPAMVVETLAPIPIKKLFHDYIATRQAIGKHRDGGANWANVFVDLIKFLGHDNARRITKRNLLDWRDSLMASGKSAKTVADKHLAAIRAVLRWAFENDRLPTNETTTVRQEVPRKVQTREKGYTTAEAVKVLKVSLNHEPADTTNPSNRESAHLTAAKRWVPLLCAFSGARVTEMTQLRKEDVRQQGERWILRITSDAGSVKNGQYRDVPLHHQVVALGFCDFLMAAKDGPLFHRAKTADNSLTSARGTSGKLSGWLKELELVPKGVQPSHGWRHRFKSQGLEIGVSVRVLNGIQGHEGNTASDGYGDVTLAAKLKMIDALPQYEFGHEGDNIKAAE